MKTQNEVKVNKLQKIIFCFWFYTSENNMIRIDPRAIVFTRGFSLERIDMVGKQITVQHLIEKRKVMTISKAMIMNIGITSMTTRPTPSYTYYYYCTHRPLYNMHLVY